MNRNKNDRNDECIAHLIRSDWFKTVHVGGALGAPLAARGEGSSSTNCVTTRTRYGLLRPFCLNVGRVSASGFDARARDLVNGNAQPRVIETAWNSTLRGT
ncbi:hypothetical protein [Mesorhizobium sp. M1143]|uniref:hypothetical protein n=1 Tax=Mesorhizobium sp. M1143 TaxID=2957061 RepID=UPI00333D8488